MMVPMRPFALCSCLVSVLAISTLVGSAHVARAAVASAADPATDLVVDPATARKERIDEVWLDAKGESGHVRTSPLYLDDSPGEYHFGPRFCRKGHRLGDATLQALQGALAAGLPVRIDATPVSMPGGSTRQCVTGVAVFAPMP